MTEILATWLGVMVVIVMLMILSGVVFLIINTFFKYLEKASKENKLSEKIKCYMICFAMFSLFMLILVTAVML